MLTAFPLHFASPTILVLALISACVVLGIGRQRRIAIPRLAIVLFAIGLFCVAFACGEPTWRRPMAREIPVYVDLSPSTRSADYRNRKQLDQRIHELLGNRPFRLHFFADGSLPDSAGAGDPLADASARRTTFSPDAAPAALLFSDGRFDLPTYAPPIYAVIDPALESPPDAAVTALNIQGSTAVATIRNRRGATRLDWTGVNGLSNERVSPGAYTLSRAVNGRTISAAFTAGDRWPENDALEVVVPPPATTEHWWVSDRAAPPGWKAVSPNDLPTDAGAYLGVSIVAIDDVAANRLAEVSQQRLLRFARDFGGGVLILGGRNAFAAGGYTGAAIDALSPLASDPPEPATHWIVLIDASGSMSADAGGGRSRWNRATEAAAALPPRLPPNDPLSLGQFAERLDWWARGVPARESSQLQIPPPGARPHGPTNLRASLEAFLISTDDTMRKELLLITDAAADLGDVAALATELRGKKTRLHALLIEPADEAAPLRQLAALTGGGVREEAAPEQWSAALRDLARSASPPRVNETPVTVQFHDVLAGSAARAVAPWNRTWLKQGATMLADADAAGERVPLAARWDVGYGSAAAAAFSPEIDTVEALSRLVAAAPRDPRFAVNWTTGSRLHVAVEASENGRFLNDQSMTLELTAIDGASLSEASDHAIPQSAPGRYELSVESPSTSAIATVRLGRRTIDHIALAGRYPPEFDAIGNDREALRRLTTRTGGRTIEPAERRPIEIDWPLRRTPVAPAFALAGATFIVTGLLRWRRGEIR